MDDLFFYGTLRHIPLLALVLGRPADSLDLSAVTLQDYAVTGVAEGPFPTIFAQKGAVAQGLQVRGLTEQDIARLDFYEGGFDYDLVPAVLSNGQRASFYMSQPGRWTPTTPWDLETWVAEHGAMNQHAAAEVMRLMGVKTRDEVNAMLPRIRDRACAKLRAAQSRHGAGTFAGQVEVQQITPAYADFFALDDIVLRHARFDGTMTAPMERAVLISSDAAIVLPYDPVRDRVLLVEQIRMGAVMRGDKSQWQLEPVAGLIDAGETPQEAARREAQEEAGLTLGALEPVAEVYSSPGNSTGFYYIYLGLADLPDTPQGGGGLAEEDEDIRSHLLSFDALMQMIDTQAAANSPLMIAGLWLARHRERLRSQGAAVRA